ncbi:uncharacterized protein GGS22DRAFT_149544 [Annulohypoxylon maeteangense]|uniref:uncharacterized protein n=1 Tax=Annulohypoxylon maeteangense TaxID=1927788 RepID=UPI0020073023|nr:uncharacterized protein GGS22DRAFT_149544 [Annulohypoxylon maeteangense]KAI0889932.1 hypothetical protein GGS22DRAFT_149544 [Annulohypoxylon maeteangense]
MAMGRSYFHSSSTASDAGESPPPPYSSRPPSIYPSSRSERTPLVSKPEIHQEVMPFSACLQLLGLIVFFLPFIFLYNLFFGGPSLPSPPPPPPPPIPTYSVAIIGAGPAGISATQHLYLESRGRDFHLNITLFESAPVIGGQLALNASAGGLVFPYDDDEQSPIIAEDIAGTALVWGNPLFTKSSEGMLGDNVEFSECPSQQVGYYSDHIVSETTRPYSKTPITNWLGLIFKYGSSVWHAGAMTKEGTGLRDHFVNPPLTTDPMQLMISLDILGSVQELARNGLDNRGISGAYVTEVLGPQVQRAHFQKILDTSTLTTMLAAAQEDYASFYVGGELVDRLEQVIGATSANVRAGATVAGIKHAYIDEENPAWLVSYGASGLSGLRAEAFDKVIIAAPNFDLYQASSIDDIEAASVLTYQPVYITFFTTPSRFRSDLFNDLNQILFFEEQAENSAFRGVRELAFVREVSRTRDDGSWGVEYLYRTLSNGDITEQLQQLDHEITWRYQTKLENAYPDLHPFRRFPTFKLSEKSLWWTSAIHTIASTVDMSWLAGQIVAGEVLKELKD